MQPDTFRSLSSSAWNNPDDINGPSNGISADNAWGAGGGDRGNTPPPPPRRSSRSRSPARNGDDRGRPDNGGGVNPGNNLHVSGLSSRADNRDLEAHFSKHGKVLKASVMYDPHTRESRGFGFVTMDTAAEAEACITNLSGTEFMGRTLAVEKARRGRARTPTPGRYFGPPKRVEERERPYDPRPYDSRYARYEDRPRYEDRYGSRYEDRYGPPPRGYGGYDDRRRDYDRRDYDRRDYDRYESRRY